MATARHRRWWASTARLWPRRSGSAARGTEREQISLVDVADASFRTQLSMDETTPAPPSTGMGSSARSCARSRLPSSGAHGRSDCQPRGQMICIRRGGQLRQSGPGCRAGDVSCCQLRTAHLAACDICRAAATGRWRGLSRLSPEKLVVQRGLPAVVSAPSRVAAHAARHAAARARSRPSEGLRERPDRGRQEGTRCAPAVCRRWRWSALAG